MEYREQLIEELKKETGFDEIVIGCFLSNYKIKHVCPIATGKWCRDYTKCKCMEEGIMRKIKEQQEHNKKIGKEEKETPVKTIVLLSVFIFIVLCCITVVAGIVELVYYRMLTGLIAWIGSKEVVLRLVVYAVISPLAAGVIYNRIKREKDE